MTPTKLASLLVAGVVAAGGLAHAQALLPAGSDLTKILIHGGTFEQGDYRLSPAERDEQRRVAGIIEKALEPLSHDPLWHVTSVDRFSDHEEELLPGAAARAGLMICAYTMELELDHDSTAFSDLMVRNAQRMESMPRLAAEAQAAAARGDAATIKRLEQTMTGPVPPTVTVHVETNPRDVSRYLNPDNRKMTAGGADFGFVTPPAQGNGVTTITLGLGGIVKNTIDQGSFIKLKPSRLWLTQHFVEISIAGDPDLTARVLPRVNFGELRRILD